MNPEVRPLLTWIFGTAEFLVGWALVAGICLPAATAGGAVLTTSDSVGLCLAWYLQPWMRDCGCLPVLSSPPLAALPSNVDLVEDVRGLARLA
ncbi:MAG: hypothetical protein QME70_13485, partial [Bacillota bacterium]|nr:hypothetical protein [Bacillota bacterium]